MEYIKEIAINEAVIHVLDNNSEDPILNEYYLELNEEVYKFLLKHIERYLKDDDLKYALFGEERNVIKELSQQYLNGESDLLEVSKELARQLFMLMKCNQNIPSADLLIVSVSTEYGPLLAILKMDYIKNYTHKINFVNEKLGVNIITDNSGLPKNKKVGKCAFIKPTREGQEFNLMVLDKVLRNEDEYGANYFTKSYLNCSCIDNERDLTKKFLYAAERFARVNLNEDAGKAEAIRQAIKTEIKHTELVNVEALAEKLFKNEELKKEFKASMDNQVGTNLIEIDSDFANKKLSKVKLKIDKDIEISITDEAYNDKSRFEVLKNLDGSISIIVKNVMNYIEK